MNVTTLVAPAAEPVGLAEAKEYLRIAYDGENGLVTTLIAAARSRIEELAGVAMISRTLRVTLDRWPMRTVETRVLRLPVRPAGDLVTVRVFDAAGVAEVVTDRFTLSPGRAARLVAVLGHLVVLLFSPRDRWEEGAGALPTAPRPLICRPLIS